MYWLTKLASNKLLVAVVFTLVFSFVCVTPLFAAPTTGVNFGLLYGKDTGLGSQDIRSTISQIINVALGLLGIVAVVVVLAGGFKWMTAGGNEEKTGEARKIIIAGVIGLAIILSAYAISRFVLEQLYKATTGNEYNAENLQ